MRKHKFFKRMPTAESIRQSKLLKPFARYLDHHALWQLNRRSVAGGVAVGLFFGIMVPFAQIFFSAIAAVIFRVNLPVAAFCTFVTNPFTFAAIYYASYRLGAFLTGQGYVSAPMAAAASETAAAQASHAPAIGLWLSSTLAWIQSVGLPLVVGLFVVSAAASLTGYLLVNGIWRLSSARRWRKRCGRRQDGGKTRQER